MTTHPSHQLHIIFNGFIFLAFLLLSTNDFTTGEFEDYCSKMSLCNKGESLPIFNNLLYHNNNSIYHNSILN